MEIEGVGTVYRYQGRANFPHQMTEADSLITADCKARNGGKPLIVDLKRRDLGVIATSNGQTNTQFNATATSSFSGIDIDGKAKATSTGSTTVMRNYNQEILYKCVVETAKK